MPCELDPVACRRRHIADRLSGAKEDSGDYEARCPVCGHATFRVSGPRVRKYRHIWTCACKRCGCTADILRVGLLGLDIPPNCLGVYDGPIQKTIAPEIALKMDLAINDIFAVGHLRPADMRLMLAEAQGREVPRDFTPFVKFAMSIGISRSRAQEAAVKWCRPADCPPQTGGAGSDTSRSTDVTAIVKPPRSEPRDTPVSGNRTARFGQPDIADIVSSDGTTAGNVQMPETGERTSENETDAAIEVLCSAGLTGTKPAA